MKNTEKEIKEIEKRLEDLYKNDNDAPRLIAEMLGKFPNPRGPRASCGTPMTHSLP